MKESHEKDPIDWHTVERYLSQPQTKGGEGEGAPIHKDDQGRAYILAPKQGMTIEDMIEQNRAKRVDYQGTLKPGSKFSFGLSPNAPLSYQHLHTEWSFDARPGGHNYSVSSEDIGVPFGGAEFPHGRVREYKLGDITGEIRVWSVNTINGVPYHDMAGDGTRVYALWRIAEREDMEELPDSDTYVKEASFPKHGSVYYASPFTKSALAILASEYKAETQQKLHLGPISLVWGGLLDVGGDCKTPIEGHRDGNQVTVYATPEKMPDMQKFESMLEKKSSILSFEYDSIQQKYEITFKEYD